MNDPLAVEKIRYIQSKLKDVEQAHRVKILLALESGSRAWGFPSGDSDYDVRFIYCRGLDDYLSVEPSRDVIETALVDDAFLGVPLDLNGWDIRKALGLALKSNAVVSEWLASPVVYMADETVVARLRRFASGVADIRSLEYHYDRLGRHSWEDIQSREPFKLKKYFYALRPALALTWLRQLKKVPPMNIFQMMEKLDLSTELRRGIRELVDKKAQAVESDLADGQPVIDGFLERVFAGEPSGKIEPAALDQVRVKEADELFLGIVKRPA